MKTAIGTVVYPGTEKYLDDFLNTVKNQTTNEFEFLVVNDGMLKGTLKRFSGLEKVKHNIIQGDGTIHGNRIKLLMEAKNCKYDLLILLDIDDIMSDNRVQEYINQFEYEYAFFFNQLYTFDNKKIFCDLPNEAKQGDMLEFNFLGLSNTAVNIGKMDKSFLESLEEGKTNIFDWYLYERIMLNGFEGKKIKGVYTKYRIHNQNIAGITQSVEREISVKKEHYKLLCNYSNKYKLLLEMYGKIGLNISKDIFNKNKKGYWWENIRLENNNV